MTNSRASGKLVTLFKHHSSGTGASLTIPLTGVTDTQYSKILIHWTLLSTATFALEMILNGDTSGYAWSATFNDSSTNAVATDTAAAEFIIMSTSVNSAANHCSGTVEIQLSDKTGAAKDVRAHSQRTRVYEDMSGYNADNAPLTEIKITTSTSTWAEGSAFIVYGLKR